MAREKVKGSLYDLVLRAIESTPARGSYDEVKLANHIAKKLGGAYVKTKAGYSRLIKKASNHDRLLALTRAEPGNSSAVVRSLLELVEGVEGGWLVRDPELLSKKTLRSILRKAHAALDGR